MDMVRSLCLLLALAMIGGCTVRTTAPKVEIEPGKVTVKADDPGTFCPPGQAKKGRC
jgi:hypothetical protein